MCMLHLVRLCQTEAAEKVMQFDRYKSETATIYNRTESTKLSLCRTTTCDETKTIEALPKVYGTCLYSAFERNMT